MFWVAQTTLQIKHCCLIAGSLFSITTSEHWISTESAAHWQHTDLWQWPRLHSRSTVFPFRNQTGYSATELIGNSKGWWYFLTSPYTAVHDAKSSKGIKEQMSVRALGAIYIIQKFGMLENVHSMENVTCACSNLPQRTEHHLQTWLKAITKSWNTDSIWALSSLCLLVQVRHLASMREVLF